MLYFTTIDTCKAINSGKHTFNMLPYVYLAFTTNPMPDAATIDESIKRGEYILSDNYAGNEQTFDCLTDALLALTTEAPNGYVYHYATNQAGEYLIVTHTQYATA